MFSDKVNRIKFICSHERSGTAFLINLVSQNSNYTSEPLLDFDYPFFSRHFNFYNPDNVYRFFKRFSIATFEGKKMTLSSLVKSHHLPLTFSKLFGRKWCSFIYIFRNPADVLISYYKFLSKTNGSIGELPKTLIEFSKLKPRGYITRYHIEEVSNYLERWFLHVKNWKELEATYDNINILRYEDLTRLQNSLVDTEDNPFHFPDPNKYIKGANIKFPLSEQKDFRNYCDKRLQEMGVIDILENYKFEDLSLENQIETIRKLLN